MSVGSVTQGATAPVQSNPSTTSNTGTGGAGLGAATANPSAGAGLGGTPRRSLDVSKDHYVSASTTANEKVTASSTQSLLGTSTASGWKTGVLASGVLTADSARIEGASRELTNGGVVSREPGPGSRPDANPNDWNVVKQNEPPKLPPTDYFAQSIPAEGGGGGLDDVQRLGFIAQGGLQAVNRTGIHNGDPLKDSPATPPRGGDKYVTTATYTSSIANASPQDVGNWVMQNPGAFFSGNGTSGLTVNGIWDHSNGHALNGPLEYGKTYDVFLVDNKGTLSPVLPIRLTPTQTADGYTQLSAVTLLGHGLNGTQTWTFGADPDHPGGTLLTQVGRFQLAYPAAAGFGGGPEGVERRQTEVWHDVHYALWKQFNPPPPPEDPGYNGAQ